MRSASASAAEPAFPPTPVRVLRRRTELGRERDAAAAFELGQAMPGVRDRGLELRDVGRERAARLFDGVAIRLHQRDRFRRFGREIVAAVGKRGGRALLQVGDALERRLQALAFRFVLRDRDRERALGAVGRGGGIANLLVEDEQGMAVREIFLRFRGRSADQGGQGLEHGWAPLL